MEQEVKKLNLACGQKYLDGYINLDYNTDLRTDLAHDLNSFPYPFADDSFDFIIADNILEHLDDLIKVMEELHRITKKGAMIDITVPYFACYTAFNDPTHKKFFTYTTFDYFTANHKYNFYTKARFKIISRKLIFSSAKYSIIFSPISYLVNKFPKVYQKFFCFMLPFNALNIKIETIK